jgi:plastocyanin
MRKQHYNPWSVARTLLFSGLVLSAMACGGGKQAAPSGETATAGGGEAGATQQAAGGESTATAAPTGTASITGTVKFDGTPPNLKPINMDADPVCAGKHSEPVYPPVLVLGPDQTMANVFVKVTAGLPAGTWPTPSEPVIIDQQGCMYVPHMVGVMTGQTLEFRNDDKILHNVHLLPKANREQNLGMPATVAHKQLTFSKAEDEPFHVKCDVHPWMSAYVGVTDNPFFAVTGQDGTFTISGLPAGTYTIQAWQEKLGTKTAQVTVADGGTQSVDFSFSVPTN